MYGGFGIVFLQLEAEMHMQAIASRVPEALFDEYAQAGMMEPLINAFETCIQRSLFDKMGEFEEAMIIGGGPARSSGRRGFLNGLLHIHDLDIFAQTETMQIHAMKLMSNKLDYKILSDLAADAGPLDNAALKTQHVPFYKKIGKQYKPKSWR